MFTVEKCIRLMAGTFILASLLLSLTVSRWWLLFTAFVGVNLVQSVFTGFCPAETIFKKLGIRESSSGTCCCGEDKH